jgi:hypothetical protein
VCEVLCWEVWALGGEGEWAWLLRAWVLFGFGGEGVAELLLLLLLALLLVLFLPVGRGRGAPLLAPLVGEYFITPSWEVRSVVWWIWGFIGIEALIVIVGWGILLICVCVISTVSSLIESGTCGDSWFSPNQG